MESDVEIAVDGLPKSDVTEMKWNVVLLTLNYIYVSTNFLTFIIKLLLNTQTQRSTAQRYRKDSM